MSGSSMAVPHVTGIAAMLYAFEPNVYPSNIKKIILSNVLELRDLKSKVNVPGIPNGLSAVTSLYQLRRDTQAPTVKTTTSFYKDQIKLSLNVTDKGGSGVRVLKYVYGKKSIDYFENGTQGTSITNNAISLKKAGLYTIYLSDYANNSRIVVVNVKDDSKAPSIQIKKTKSGTKTKITARVTDSESGVLKVKYKKGTHSTSDFLSSKFGTVLTGKKNTYTFYVSEPGTYTIYATDYRGNKTVSHIKV